MATPAYPDSIYTPGAAPAGTNSVSTQLDATYFDVRDYEIHAIETALGEDLVPDDETGFSTYARVAGTTLYLNLAPIGGDKVGVGPFCSALPKGWLHVRHGSVDTTVSLNADDLVLEEDDNVGLTMLFPDEKNGNIYWRSPTEGARGQMQYIGADSTFQIGTLETGGEVRFRSGDNKLAVTIEDDQLARFANHVVVMKGNMRVRDGVVNLGELTGTPTNPGLEDECHLYMKADKFVIAYRDSVEGTPTMKYRYLDLTADDDPPVWVYTETAP